MTITATTTETLVNTTTTGQQTQSTLTRLYNAGGIFIGTLVVWVSDSQSGGEGNDIVMQRYNAAGAKVGAETIVNTTLTGNEYNPTVTALAGGLYAIAWEGTDNYARGSFVQVYTSAGVKVGDEIQVANSADYQYEPQVVAVSGGFVVSYLTEFGDANGRAINAQRFAITGSAGSYAIAYADQAGTVLADQTQRANFLVNQIETGAQQRGSSFGLASGGALYLFESPDTNGSGLFGRIMAANGTFGAQFQVSSEAGNTQAWGDAVQLANGNIFVSWSSLGQDGSGWGVYGRILSATGVPVSDEFRMNEEVPGNQSNADSMQQGPKLALLDDGSVVGVWYTDSDNYTEVLARRFKADGSPDGHQIEVNVERTYLQYSPDVVAIAGGFRVSWQSIPNFSDWDIYSRDFTYSGIISTTQPVQRTGGEDQVNTGAISDQENATVISRADGSYVIVWASQTNLSTGDGSGWGLFAQRYSAAGARVGGEFQINQSALGDQRYPNATMLSDGRFAVAWHTGNDDSGADSYFRIFNADGTAATGDIRLNANADRDSFPAISALSTGGFVAIWNTYYYSGGAQFDVWGQRFNASGVAVGGEFRVSETGGPNTYDGVEASSDTVLGLNNGRFVIVYEDHDGQDGSAIGLYGRIYTAAGVGGAIFQINSYTDSNQSQANLAKFANGSFVVVWQSYGQDTSYEGIYARVFDANGVALTDDIRINSNRQYGQYAPQVAVLADDSFAVTWSSDHDDGIGGTDVYVARYSATGQMLNEDVRVNREVSANSDRFSDIAATENGFVVTWVQEDAGRGGADGDGDGIFRQEFTIDGLNAIAGERADRPSIALAGGTNLIVNGGAETGTAAASFTAVVNPAGWTAVTGSMTAVQYAIGGTEYLNAADSAEVTGGNDYFAGGPDSPVSTIRQTINVAAQATQIDTGRIYARLDGDFGGFSYDNDTTAMTVIYRNASGIELGRRTIGPVQHYERGYVTQLDHRSALSLVPTGTRTIDVELTAVRASGEYNDGYADNLSLILSPAGVGAEGSPIAIPLVIALQDANTATAETLRVEVAGIPVGATLSDGVRSFTATRFADTVDITAWTRNALTITPPPGSEADFTLEIRATATETATGDTATTVRTIAIDVQPTAEPTVRDAPTVRVNAQIADQQTDPQIVRDAATGNVVVTWQSQAQDGSGFGVYLQMYSASGALIGGERQIAQTTAGDQTEAQATYLANGQFVVVWSSLDTGAWRVVQRLFNADGTPAGAEQQVDNHNIQYYYSQPFPHIAALADGGWLTSWNGYTPDLDGNLNGVYAQRYSAAGVAVMRDGSAAGTDIILVNTVTQSYEDEQQIVGTADGGWFAVYTGYEQVGDSADGILAQRFGAAGEKIGAEFRVNQFTDVTQRDPQIAVLTNGNILMAWITDSGADSDPSGFGISARLYSSTGVALTDEFAVNADKANSQTEPTIAAMPDGAFAIAWQDDYRANGHDIALQLFDAEGNRIGDQAVVNSQPSGYDYSPSIVYDGVGFTAVWADDNIDGNGQGIAIRRISLPSDDVAAVGGARVVPTQTAYNQSQGGTATLADGSYVVVWTSAPSAGDGDVSSYGIRMQRFSAAGERIGGETSVNSNVAYEQSAPSIAALDGGGYVIVWNSETGDGSANGIFAQRFDAAGMRVGEEFRINDDPAGNQIYADVAALHGAQVGGFAVTWQDGSNVFARAFDAAGRAIGGDLRVDQAIERVSNGDSTESEARITGDATGGFTVVFQDYDGDKNSWAVIGQRYAISGGTVSAIGGTNSDGSTSPSNFRVNTGYYGGQYQPDIVTLADGGSVVVWYSDDVAGVQAQMYNANGSLRGGEFNLDDNAPGYQYEPSIAALGDGGFVAVWRDDNGNYSDIRGARFSASGAVLDRFTVTGADWYQLQPEVVAQGDGFNVVFTTNGGQDGFGAPTTVDALGVLIQHFAIDYGADAGEKIAQRPTLTLGASVTGAEDAPIALSVVGALNDSDGGSETLRLVIENLPAGSRLSDGVRSFTATPQAPAVDVTSWTLSALTLTPPRDFNGTFTLNLRATATEAQGDTAYNTGTIQVNVTPVDEVLPEYGAERQNNVWTSDQQWYPSVASQDDGSYLVVWLSQSQPGQPYYSIVAQRHANDGTKLGTEFSIDSAGNYADNAKAIALADGTYLVSMQRDDSQAQYGATGIWLQRVSADGQLLNIAGGTTDPVASLANTTFLGEQRGQNLTALADGGWVVTWHSQRLDASNSYGIDYQRFAADGTKTGAETRVNLDTTGQHVAPDIASLPDGSLVFAWQAPTGILARIIRPDGSSTSDIAIDSDGAAPQLEALPNGTIVVVWQDSNDIYGQRLNADGTFAGSFFRVNSYAYDAQVEPSIAVLPDGGYMVTWSSSGQDGSVYGVYGQRYDSLGAAVGTEFRVNRAISGQQSTASVVAQGDGSGVIVVFEGQDGSGDGVFDIRLPLPDASTPPAIAFAQTEQQVNDPDIAAAASYQNESSVTKLADGSYIVTYSSYTQDESGYGIYARHYEADGDAILWNGTDREKLINLSTGTDQYYSATAAFSAEDGGGFVVVYQSNHDYYGIYARRYDAAGNTVQLTDANGDLVDELRISAPTTYSHNPAVSVGSDGAFTVTFMSDRDGQSYDIYAHTVDATGQLAAGGDIRINQNVESEQNYVSMTALAGGGHVATWHSAGHDGSSWGIYARMLDAAGQPIGGEFLINTYTDNEQSHPSVAALTNGGFVVVWNTTTGYDTDDSGYGIAGQRYTVSGGVATRAGGEFVVNGIAANSQIHPYAIGTQDGGFIAAWRSEAADNSSYAIAGRRFDSAGNATEPYGNDFIINTTTAGDQSEVRLALLDRGFVATWTSDEAAGTIRMQRFEGAGLEPPPYVVDPLTGNDTNIDKVYATIQQALDAALADGVEGQTILIKGGTYTEALTVQIDDLKIVNAAGETVIIRAPSDAVALQVAQNLNLTIRGDAATRLVFEGAAGQDTVRFLGNNDGSEITKATIASSATGQGLVLLGGQDGVTVQDNVFTGANNLSALGANAVLGLGVSSNIVILRNAFTTSDGFAIDSAASVGRIVENVFGGSAALAAASVVLTGTGTEVAFNRFQAGVGPHFRDAGANYDEAAIIAGNAFPEGYVRGAATNVLYSTIAHAIGSALPGETVSISGGAWNEGVVAIGVDNLTVSAPGGLTPATGIAFVLGAGVTTLTLADAANIDVTGNGIANVITGNAGNNVLSGDAGDDMLVGGAGLDGLSGGAGDDTLDVTLDGSTADLLDGGADDDIAIIRTAGYYGSYTLSGTASAVSIAGTDGVARATATNVETFAVALNYGESLTVTALPTLPTVVVGGAGGNNVLTTTASTTEVYFDGGSGDDTFTGGAAFDGILYRSATTPVIVNLGTTAITFGGNTVAAGRALDEFGNTDTLSGIDYVQTGSGNDRVDGGALGETILTGLGNDIVNGGGGADRIFAGLGTNTLAGGAGSDIYYIESATDTITEAAGAANGTADTVRTALATYSIASFANVENLEADSDIAHTFTGNTGANRIVGGAGGDTLNGGNGDDVLVGGLGSNTLNGGNNFDTVDYSALTGPVEVDLSFGFANNVAAGTSDTLSGIERIIGTAQNDSIGAAGGTGAETFEGGGGNDLLIGGGGNDTLIGGAGSDTVAYVSGGPANGALARTGVNAWTFTSATGGGTEGVDTLQTIEAVKFLGPNIVSAADDRTFAIVAGNVAVQSAADTGAATEAGGIANATASVNATGNVLTNDVNLDESTAASDVMKVATIAWTSATGPGSGTGTGATNVAASGNTAIDGRYGTLTLNAAGGYTYTPDATRSDLIPLGTTATEVFTYTASDGIGAAATATLTISLAGRNDAPVVANVALSGSENAASIGGTLTGTDVDTGATLTFARVAGSVRINGTTVADGTVTVNANGSYSYVTGAADQALNTGETRVVTFNYVANDGIANSVPRTVTLTVTGANDVPVAVADTGATTENVALTTDVLANDTDIDTSHVFTLVSAATALAGKGTVSIVGNQLVFTPGTAFDHLKAGAIEDVVVNYTMRDDQNATSSSTLTIRVTGTNDAPVAVANTATTAENTNLSVNVLANDSDVDDDAVLTLVSANVPAGKGTANIVNNRLVFVPGAAFDRLSVGVSEVVVIGYTMRDENNATSTANLTITVTGVNDAPVAIADTASGTENQALLIDVLANDTDRDDVRPFTLVSVSNAGAGGVSIVDNKLAFAPGSAFDHLAVGVTETVTLGYVMRDDQNAQSSASVTVTITGTNDAPVAVADSGATTENAAVTVNVLANDTDVDDGAVLTLVSASAPAGKGSASVSGGSVTFTPGTAFDHLAAGATESVAIGYVVRDQQNASVNGTLTITVTGTNDAPVAVADTATTGENAVLFFNPLTNDTDVDDGAVLTLVSASAPAGKGTASVVGGQIRFAPGIVFDHLAAGASEVVTLTYVMRDQAGAQSTATVALTVTGVNDAPVAVADSGATTENAAVTVNVLANDRDVDDGAVLTLVSATPPAGKGSASISGGSVTFTPGTAFDHLAAGATETVAIGYVVRDAQNASVNGTLTITVTGTNDAPVAVADAATTGENTVLLFNPLINDTDADDGAVLTLVSATGPAGKGTVSVTGGQVRFAPGTAFDHLAAGASEVVNLSYVVRDQTGAQTTGSVALTVTGVNDRPVAPSDTGAVLENQNVILFPLANDSDVDDGARLTIANLVVPEGRGTGTIIGGNRISFQTGTAFDRLAPGDTQAVVLRFDVIDGQGGVTPSFTTVTVTGTNDRPRPTADTVVAQEDAVVTIPVATLLANDRDYDIGQTLTITGVRDSVNGTVTLVDGVVTFVPNANFVGRASFIYTVDDGAGGTTDARAYVVLQAVADPGVARNDAFATSETTNVSGNLFADNGSGVDVDVDSALRVAQVNGVAGNVGQLLTLASGARLNVAASGAFTYNPNGAFAGLSGVTGASNTAGSDSFTYGLLNGGTATVTIAIAGVSTPGDRALGTAGNDVMTGGARDETFMLNAGGNDTANGLGGDDDFYFGAALTAADIVDGGAGAFDEVIVQGNYPALNLTAAMFTGIEALSLLSGLDTRFGAPGGQSFSYVVRTVDANVGAGQTLTVAAAGLQAGENFTFNGALESDGAFLVFGGRGTDLLTGGAGADVFLFGPSAFGASDRVVGGGGVDTLALQGDYTLSFGASQLSGIEAIVAVSATDPRYPVPGESFSYALTLANGNVTGTLAIDGTGLTATEVLNVDGRLVTGGALIITGGASNDVLVGGTRGDTLSGGANGDTLIGGLGADILNGGAGGDVLIYAGAADSTRGTGYDTVIGFDFAADRFDVTGATAAYHRDASIGGATLSSATFDAQLQGAVAGVLTSGGATFVTATAGTLSGHMFLVVDQNGVAGYQAGADLVIDLVSPVNMPATGVDFLI